MSRPIYENDESKSNEVRIVSAFASKMNLSFRKMPTKNVIDFSLYGKTNTAYMLAETKWRDNVFGKYPTYLIAISKVVSARSYRTFVDLETLLLVEFIDEVYYTMLSTATGDIKLAGRSDRNDSQDMEPCLMIPLNLFYKL